MKPRRATSPEQDTNARHPLLVTLRNGFVSGLVVFAPIGITLFVFSWIFRRGGNILRPFFRNYLPNPDSIAWDIVATLVLVALITLLGLVSRYVLSRWFFGFVDQLARKIPGVGAVYNAVKQIIDTFSSQNKNAFSKVVLVEFPRAGVYSIGFLTNKAVGEAQTKLRDEMWAVFVPTAPNPTTGFLIVVPRAEVVELEMSVGEGMKFIVSVGAVVPPWPPGAADAQPRTVPDAAAEKTRGAD